MHFYSLQQMLMIIVGLPIFICFLVFRTFDKTLALLNIFWPKSKLSWVLWWRGGNRKESLQLCFWNLNICIEKVDAKCCLAKMTLLMMSLPLARVFQCLFKLRVDWQKSDNSVDGEPQGIWWWSIKFQRCICMLSFLFLPCRQSALESLLAG